MRKIVFMANKKINSYNGYMKTIYFDNSATTIFKPKSVRQTLKKMLSLANSGRSGHRLSIKSGLLVQKAREKVGNHFGISSQNIIFTKNCTEGLNIALLGLLKGSKKHVITTPFEHNSVLRPLYELERRGEITLSICKCQNFVKKEDIEKEITQNTYLVCVTAISNVTGERNDIEGIGKFCKEKGILFLVDFAQMAGHEKIDMQKLNINFLAFSGHKGFLAPQGIGGLCINSSTLPYPILFGGTGSESQNKTQPKNLPERLECGTLSAPLICALGCGIEYVERHFEKHNKKLLKITSYLHKKLRDIDGVKIYSPQKSLSGIVSFNIKDFPSSEVADFLDKKYKICVRSGLHCAPLCHKHFGTDNQGMVRASLSFKNTKNEVDRLVKGVKEFIKKSLK